MNTQRPTKLLEKIFPYFIIGVSLTIAIALFILLFYLFIWGIIIGGILWGVILLKEKFFSSNYSLNDDDSEFIIHTVDESHHKSTSHKGRVIDMEDCSQNPRGKNESH